MLQKILICILAVLLILLGIMLLMLREQSRSVPEQAAVVSTSVPGQSVTPSPPLETAPAMTAAPLPETESAPVVPAPDFTSARTRELVRALLGSYGDSLGALPPAVYDTLDEFSAVDPVGAGRWGRIMDYWQMLNLDFTVNPDICPEGLPDDSSLCIVVLGYQLERDGSMKPELIRRLEAALACANRYPRAYVAVTGGGTALYAPSVTEADSMAAWLIEHGVSPWRLIVENQSLSTGQNAVYTNTIFQSLYPTIRSVVIVTSDYHVRRGCLAFTAEFILSDSDLQVVSNAGISPGKYNADRPYIQSIDLMDVVRLYYTGDQP